MKVPGRLVCVTVELGEGDSSGPHLNRQTGPDLSAPLQQRGPGLSQMPASHHQSDGCGGVAWDSLSGIPGTLPALALSRANEGGGGNKDLMEVPWGTDMD